MICSSLVCTFHGIYSDTPAQSGNGIGYSILSLIQVYQTLPKATLKRIELYLIYVQTES
ncbi:hypothetical protein Hanom_Chr06g00542181 [Helianthus anomalus]